MPELTTVDAARAHTSGVLRYHEAGEGPPLLMLHGSGPGVTGWRNFRGNLARFAEHFRCLVLEFPGFGVSDPTDEHPMTAAGGAVTRFLDGLGLPRVDVIGNSMGGIVATQVALRHPERIRRLVTIGGIGRNVFSPAPGEGIKLLMEFTDNPTREGLVSGCTPCTTPHRHGDDRERWKQATDPGTPRRGRHAGRRRWPRAKAMAA